MVTGSDGDAMGLLGDLPVTKEGEASSGPPAKKQRNAQLRTWELPPRILLNPMGKSGVGSISVQTLWELWAKGSEKTAFHSNLHNTDPGRCCVGISQFAEMLEATVQHIAADKVLDLIVKPERVSRRLGMRGPFCSRHSQP